ncbi:HNH endonuclease [Pseudomonas sp. NPDC088444]|uniref:HNH endonuclease n=1 Tax=Pseudomonas sp. NPDC088444 TaxID=3364456 RepID=UPI00384E445E
MELVSNEEQVAENLAELDRAGSSSGDGRQIYLDLIKHGKCYLPYLNESGIAFAPSRFIGYVNNKIRAHGSNQDKHGSKTNVALNRIYGSHPVHHGGLQLEFERFCISIGVKPSRDGSFGTTRKYWLTEDVAEVIAKGQEQQILADAVLTETEKMQLILARVGQGAFRQKLVKHWGKCSATDCSQIDILRASHIKPWRESSNGERLDVYNGLLLNPSLDALFDKGYVSFDDKGQILISPYLSESDRKILNCSSDLNVKLSPEHLKYLAWHRENLFWAEL